MKHYYAEHSVSCNYNFLYPRNKNRIIIFCSHCYRQKDAVHDIQHKLMNLLFISQRGVYTQGIIPSWYTTEHRQNTHYKTYKLNNNVKSVPSIIYMKVQRKSL